MGEHAAHRMHHHSMKVYAETPFERADRKQLVYNWISLHGPVTCRQVKDGLGFHDVNAVQPRITELVEAGELAEVGKTKCDVTGRTVRLVDVVRTDVRGLPLFDRGK